GGRAVAGGAHGTAVTGPAGNTYAHGGAGGGAAGTRGGGPARAPGTGGPGAGKNTPRHSGGRGRAPAAPGAGPAPTPPAGGAGRMRGAVGRVRPVLPLPGAVVGAWCALTILWPAAPREMQQRQAPLQRWSGACRFHASSLWDRPLTLHFSSLHPPSSPRR